MRRTVAVLGLAAIAGCGSTVQYSGTATRTDGLSTTGGSLAGTATSSGGVVTQPLNPATGQGTTGATTGATSGSSTSGTSAGATGQQPGLPTPESAATGRGFTRTTIRIGYATADDYNTFAGGLGLQGVNAGDPKAQTKVVIDDLNRRGGLAGRKIELVPHDFNTAQVLSDPETANQAACATWTQDNAVYAVILPAIITNNLLECLHKAQTPLVTAGLEFPRRYGAVYTKYPSYFHIGAMVGDRYDRLAVGRLVKRNYFEKWDTLNGRAGGTAEVRIGVIVRNDEEGATQEKSIVSELARHGLKPHSVDHCTSTINAASCMQSVQLRYQTARITHVMGNSDLNFMNAAEAQRYRPRYFMVGSYDLFAQNAPAAQLSGAMGEGFMPASDVPESKDPGPPTPATTACLNLMRRNGQTPSTRLAASTMLATCDAGSFLKAAVDGTGALGPGLLRRGFEALGTRVQSATTWAVRFTPRQHAGVFGLRDLLFDSTCRCFVYTSKTTHVG